MLIPFVFELRQGPRFQAPTFVLVIPHAMASRSLPPPISLNCVLWCVLFLIKSAIAASSTFLSYGGSNDLNPLLANLNEGQNRQPNGTTTAFYLRNGKRLGCIEPAFL